MAGLIDRIGALAGTELGKALDLAHGVYLERMGVHNHTGRAIVETAAEVARAHPNLVGIGVGLLVEQFLTEQKRRHDIHLAELQGEAEAGGVKTKAPPPAAGTPSPPPRPPRPDLHIPLVHHDLIQLHALRPGKIALELFGALVLLKLASSGLRWFRHDKQHEAWFGPAARIRLWSATIATYYVVKSLKSPKVSAWRNAAVALFATDALKPVLKAPKTRRSNPPARPAPPALSRPAAPGITPATAPAPAPSTPAAPPSSAAPSAAQDLAPAPHPNGSALH